MKRLIGENANRIMKKRLLSGVLVSTLLVTGIGSMLYLKPDKVEAKETLDSIAQVVKNTTTDNPYTILEIVPSDVSYSVSVNDSYGINHTISGNQKMGFTGYYIAGSEPVRSDIKSVISDSVSSNGNYIRSTLSDANLRQETVNALLEPLVVQGVINNTKNERTAISVDTYTKSGDKRRKYLNAYTEIREGENSLSRKEFEAKISDYSLIKRDYVAENGDAYIDTAKGEMLYNLDVDSYGNLKYDNYIKRYMPSFVSDEHPDVARNFISDYLSLSANTLSEDSFLRYIPVGYDIPDDEITDVDYDEIIGDFDPYVSYVEKEDTEVSANVCVSFNVLPKGAKSGYIVTGAVDDVTKDSDLPLDTPLYGLDGNIFYYAGTFGSLFRNAGSISNDSVPEIVIETHENELILAKGNNNILVTNTLAEDNVLSDEEQLLKEDDNEDSLIKEDDSLEGVLSDDSELITDSVEINETVDYEENDGHYYNVHFAYSDDDTNNIFYQVSGFHGADESHGAQYIICSDDKNEYFVPNCMGTGTISVKDDCTNDYFVYDYSQDKGNYKWVSTPYSSEEYDSAIVYRISGARIYYKLNITNNEWFKQYVFDRESGDECSKLPVHVTRRTVKNVTEDDVKSNKMVVLMSGDTSFTIGNSYNNYDKESNDCSEEVFKKILERESTEDIPIICDYNIISDLSSDNDHITDSYVYYLIKAMMLNSPDLYYQAIAGLPLGNPINRAEPDTYSNDLYYLSGNSCHFVNDNAYIYNMKVKVEKEYEYVNFLNSFMFTMNKKGSNVKGFSDEEVKAGFEEVIIDIQNENLFRRTDNNSKEIDTNITEATAIRYIIGFSTRRVEVKKGEMKILEIEPCASFDLSVDDNSGKSSGTQKKNEKNIRAVNGTFESTNGKLYLNKSDGTKEEIINQEGATIRLTRMSTAEFIGHIEDLNADYDMIYVGSNVNLYNTTEIRHNDLIETVPNYNDDSMDGLIYCNVGDYTYMRQALLGLKDVEYKNNDRNNGLKSNSDEYDKNSGDLRDRYSGNDIIEEKAAALKEFVNAGYPVVLADNLLVSVSDANKVINTNRVDTASYMYDFLNDVANKTNVFALSNLKNNEKLFNWYLNLSKPQIEMFSDSKNALIETQNLTKNPSDGYYYATFDFELSNLGAASSESTYDVELYIDVNADGKYSTSQEGISFSNIVVTSGGTVSKTADGTYALTTGVRYAATCKLSSSFVGVLPWRIVVTQNDNKLRRCNATGYYKIIPEKPTEIKVLQLVQVNNPPYGNNTTWNMEESLTKNGNFKKYLKDEEDIRKQYDVQITSMRSDQFNSNYGPGKDQSYYDKLCEYDMLILGFADAYIGPNEEATIAIKQFINDGRSILFTHDTTSFINVKDTSKYVAGNYQFTNWKWGYDFNTYIRNLVGMDRFNILNNTESASNHKYDVPYAPNSGVRSGSGTASGSSVAGGIQTADNHGFNNFCMNFYGIHNGSSKTGDFPTFLNLKGIENTNGQQGGNTVTKVNDGQITKYPYVLTDSFPVAKTHCQYYQLDFTADDDMDGESDIVVWYCISDSSKSFGDGDMYEMSPNDVRNNYYIYNKGNITYSGVGHSKVVDDNGNGSEMEIKLFINTLIAAYRTGVHEPELNVVESYEENARKVSNIYVSYEKLLKASDNNGIIEENEDLYFNSSKVSLMQNSALIEHKLSAKLYREVPNGTAGAIQLEYKDGMVNVIEIPIAGNISYLDSLGNEIAADPNDLKDTVTYKVRVPVTYSSLGEVWDTYTAGVSSNSLNTRRIFVVATDSTKNIKTGRSNSMSNVEAVSLVRTQVFDLD